MFILYSIILLLTIGGYIFYRKCMNIKSMLENMYLASELDRCNVYQDCVGQFPLRVTVYNGLLLVEYNSMYDIMQVETRESFINEFWKINKKNRVGIIKIIKLVLNYD